MNFKEEITYRVSVFIAGFPETVKHILARECEKEGLCVTVKKCDFVYTNGLEKGVEIGFVNYPRFPKPAIQIYDRACKIAEILIKETYQRSALVVGDSTTKWIYTKESN
jgi:hypothetical protein